MPGTAMKSQKIIFSIALLFFGSLIVSMDVGSFKSTRLLKDKEPTGNILVNYGEQVFQREGCLTCHTLHVEFAAREGKLSLDGYAGERSSAWLFELLKDPKKVIPNTVMPSYYFLAETTLNEHWLKKMIGRPSEAELDSLWKKLNLQADEISKSLDEDYIEHQKRTEALALIAYLQQIPPSKEKARRDSIAQAKRDKELREFKDFLSDENSIIYKGVGHDDYVSEGKELFHSYCRPCHGDNAQGVIGPNLTDEYWLYGGKATNIAHTIMNGTRNGMPRHKDRLSYEEIGRLVAFILSIQGSEPENPKAPQGKKMGEE